MLVLVWIHSPKWGGFYDKLRADVGTKNSKGSVINRSSWFSTLGSIFLVLHRKLAPKLYLLHNSRMAKLMATQTHGGPSAALANFLSSPSKNRLRFTKYFYNLSSNQDFWYLHRPLIFPKNLSLLIYFFLYRWGKI